ncbi:hypothetical protein B0H19DRAFT_1055618 [Mycena capillaripes]|nr:hypothetical protein B0H19DRAFT_1055618 [Mycena capillaripes]
MAGRRTLRSGKEFSAFDLAVSRAISAPVHFNAGECIKQRLLEEARDDDDAFAEPPPFWLAGPLSPAPSSREPSPEPSADGARALPPSSEPSPAPASPATPSLAPPSLAAAPPALPSTLSAKERNKLKSRARRERKRENARAASDNPLSKAVHRKRVLSAKPAALELDIDATNLPHSQRAWQGSAGADNEPFEFGEPQCPHDLETGLGGISYTQEEVDLLTGTEGFMYISWLGHLTIPLLDAQRRVIAVLGGTPRDHAGWKVVTGGAAALLEERQPRIKLATEALHHRRAQDAFPAIARGVAHGGGRMEPAEVHQNGTNTQLTDELLAHDYIQRIMSFASSLVLLWAPLLNAFYLANNALLRKWKPSMHWHVNTIFAACTFNFGPRAITAPHLDFANLAWGWCSVTALGNFDPDFGGHLILSSSASPPARHSSSPLPWYDTQTSPSYSAGSLFRWVRNGCKTDADFESSASAEEKAARVAEDAQRWEEGMKMFSVVDDL